LAQFLMDLGHGTVPGVAQGADEGDDLQGELMLGQSPASFFLGAIGPQEAGAGGIVAASDLQVQADQLIEGSDVPSTHIDARPRPDYHSRPWQKPVQS
jgi:hypothetical protein